MNATKLRATVINTTSLRTKLVNTTNLRATVRRDGACAAHLCRLADHGIFNLLEVKTALFVVIFVEVLATHGDNGKKGNVDDEIEEEEIARGVLGVVVLARRRTSPLRRRTSARQHMGRCVRVHGLSISRVGGAPAHLPKPEAVPRRLLAAVAARAAVLDQLEHDHPDVDGEGDDVGVR